VVSRRVAKVDAFRVSWQARNHEPSTAPSLHFALSRAPVFFELISTSLTRRAQGEPSLLGELRLLDMPGLNVPNLSETILKTRAELKINNEPLQAAVDLVHDFYPVTS
jgi:hypothetical protein